MKLFQDHEGERVIMQCSDAEVKIDGFIIGIVEGCIHLAASPDGKGTNKYVPWPNPNVVSIEFIGKRNQGGVY